MTVIQKTIGRLPVNLGGYNSTRAYGRKNRCLQYGCEVESLVENNTDAPFTWDGDKTFTLNPNWRLISGNPEVWAAGNPKPAASVDHPYNGMGRVMIPKNMQNIAEEGEPENIVNLLTQAAFEDGEGNPLENTVFVIQYDFTLGEDITVPANCVLEFDGGSITRGSGNTTGYIAYDDGFKVISKNSTPCFIDLYIQPHVYLESGYSGEYILVDWFKSSSSTSTNDTPSVNLAISAAAAAWMNMYGGRNILKFGSKTYHISSIELNNCINLDFNGATVRPVGTNAYFLKVKSTFNPYGDNGVVIENLDFWGNSHNPEYSYDNIFLIGPSSSTYPTVNTVFRNISVRNTTITDSVFMSKTQHGMVIRDCQIQNCTATRGVYLSHSGSDGDGNLIYNFGTVIDHVDISVNNTINNGIYMEGGNCSIMNSIIEGCAHYGICLSSTSGIERQCSVINNYFEYNALGDIKCPGGSKENLIAVGNITGGAAGEHFIVTGIDSHVTVIGNLIIGQKGGVYADGNNYIHVVEQGNMIPDILAGNVQGYSHNSILNDSAWVMNQTASPKREFRNTTSSKKYYEITFTDTVDIDIVESGDAANFKAFKRGNNAPFGYKVCGGSVSSKAQKDSEKVYVELASGYAYLNVSSLMQYDVKEITKAYYDTLTLTDFS